MQSVNTKWFKEKLQEKEITQRRVAAVLGIDPSSVSLLLTGSRRCQLSEAEEIARLLGQPLDDVLTNFGVDPTAGSAARMVPIVGWISGHNEVTMKRPVDGPRLVEAPPGVPSGTVALRYRAASGPLENHDGRILFYEPRKTVEGDCIGQFCIIQTAGHGCHARRLKRGYIKNSYNITGNYASIKTLENVAVEWASPVLWIKTSI